MIARHGRNEINVVMEGRTTTQEIKRRSRTKTATTQEVKEYEETKTLVALGFELLKTGS